MTNGTRHGDAARRVHDDGQASDPMREAKADAAATSETGGPVEVPRAASLTQTQLGSYPLQAMYARRRIVLELSPHELRYVLRLARKLRKAGHRMPPFDVSHVLSVCLTAGMAAVAKELEQAAETPVNAGGDDSAGALPGV